MNRNAPYNQERTINVTAILQRIPPSSDPHRVMTNPENRTAEPYDLAIVDTTSRHRRAVTGSTGGIPTYVTNVKNMGGIAKGTVKNLASNEYKSDEEEAKTYTRNRLLGIVNTTAGLGDGSRNPERPANIIYQHGTTSVVNTGDEVIEANDILIWQIPMKDIDGDASVLKDEKGNRLTDTSELQARATKRRKDHETNPHMRKRVVPIVRPWRGKKNLSALQNMKRLARLRSMGAVFGVALKRAKQRELIAVRLTMV